MIAVLRSLCSASTLDQRPQWADLCRSRAMMEGRCGAQSCRPRSRNAWNAGPAAKASDSADYRLHTIPPTTDQSVSRRQRFSLLPRRPYGRRTTASARAAVVTGGQTRRKPIAPSVACGMKTCRCRKPLDGGRSEGKGFPNQGRPERIALENLNTAGVQQAHN